MSDNCPVVTIATKNGPVEINESDFDSKTMKLASDAEITKAAKPAEPVKSAGKSEKSE